QRRVGAAGLCGGGGDVGAVVQHEPEGSGEVFSGWGVGHRGYARNTFQRKGNCGLCPLLSPRAAVPASGGRTLLCCDVVACVAPHWPLSSSGRSCTDQFRCCSCSWPFTAARW